ncbi:unnamed protein product [Brassica oleracea]
MGCEEDDDLSAFISSDKNEGTQLEHEKAMNIIRPIDMPNLRLPESIGTVMQGFISCNRAETYRPHLKAGATYTLQIFFATRSKEIYRVADQSLTISFSNGSVLLPLTTMTSPSLSLSPQTSSGSTHMRISKLTVDSGATSTISLLIFKNNVVDVVGHLRLVNGQLRIGLMQMMLLGLRQ